MSGAGSRLLLSGYYGFDNFGDEAILRVFVDQWRRRRGTDTLRVLSAKPVDTARSLHVEGVPRMSHRAIATALRDTDVFISGGGGLLQSSTSLRSLLYYTGLIQEAGRRVCKTAIFAQGIGPLGFTAKHVVRRSCARLDLAIVRDPSSAALLADLVPGVDVRVGADPVFLASSHVPDEAERRLAGEGILTGGRLVAFVVRRSRALDRLATELARAADAFAGRFGASVIFVPFQRPDDVEASVSIIRRCRTAPVLLGGGYDLATMTALFSRCAAVVAMRLHALILAARLAVPFLAVPYDPKIIALAQALGYPLAPLQPGMASDLVEELWSSRETLAAHLKTGAQSQRELASKAFDWLQVFVEGSLS